MTTPLSKRTLRTTLIFGAAVLVLVIAVSDRWQGKGTLNEKEGSRFTAGTPDSALLAVAAKQPVGSVLVETAELPRPGYIVVQEQLFDSPGIIVGASNYIESGRIENLTIELTRAFSGTEQFYVSVRADNGDGRFKQIDDVVMTDATGSPAQATVQLQGAGSEPSDITLPESVQTE